MRKLCPNQPSLRLSLRQDKVLKLLDFKKVTATIRLLASF